MPWKVNVAAPQPIPLTTIFSGEEHDVDDDHDVLQRTPSSIARYGHAILSWRSQRNGWDHWWPRSSRHVRGGASKDSDGSDEESGDCDITAGDDRALVRKHNQNDSCWNATCVPALALVALASLLTGFWFLWRISECGLRRECLFAS